MTNDPLCILAAARKRPASCYPITASDFFGLPGRSTDPDDHGLSTVRKQSAIDRSRQSAAEHLRGGGNHCNPTDGAVRSRQGRDHRQDVRNTEAETIVTVWHQHFEQPAGPQRVNNVPWNSSLPFYSLSTSGKPAREVSRIIEQLLSVVSFLIPINCAVQGFVDRRDHYLLHRDLQVGGLQGAPTRYAYVLVRRKLGEACCRTISIAKKTVTSLMFRAVSENLTNRKSGWAKKARSGLKYEHRRLQMVGTYPDRRRIDEGDSRER